MVRGMVDGGAILGIAQGEYKIRPYGTISGPEGD